MAWGLRGTYLEACNCEAICPCRRVGGRQGGRSTYGICEGALSWAIEDGHCEEVDLSGLSAVLALRYSVKRITIAVNLNITSATDSQNPSIVSLERPRTCVSPMANNTDQTTTCSI